MSKISKFVKTELVDDSFVIIKNDFVSAFLETLNSIDPKISFTIETEENGQIAFLDTRQQEQRCHLLTCTENQHTPIDIWITIHITRENTTLASTLSKRASNLPRITGGNFKKSNMSRTL